MPMTLPAVPTVPGANRALAAAGAILAAASVGLAAYAAHAVEPGAQARLQSAAWFAFGHGIALAALAPRALQRVGQVALAGLLLGTLAFSGSLVGAHLFGAATTLAPFGGGLMILSWLLWAAHASRR